MKNKIVADASAILALINNEEGKEVVEKMLPNLIISSINFAEIITVLNRSGFDSNKIIPLLKTIIPNIIEFNYDQACIAANLDKDTKKFGLSLGDRCCIALAKYFKCCALTVDKNWEKLNLEVKIKQIR